MKRDIKLYNLIFPMWGIYFYAILFPYFFVLLLPANFIVDTVMLLLLFFLFKVPEKKELYRKGIWKAWGFGFLADFLAAGVLVIISSAVSLPFSYICAVFLCGSVFICNGWRSSGRGTDLLLPYKVRMEGNSIRGRKEKENRTGDGDTDGTVPDVSVAAIRREEGA